MHKKIISHLVWYTDCKIYFNFFLSQEKIAENINHSASIKKNVVEELQS